LKLIGRDLRTFSLSKPPTLAAACIRGGFFHIDNRYVDAKRLENGVSLTIVREDDSQQSVTGCRR
jgi:hypothetical protein